MATRDNHRIHKDEEQAPEATALGKATNPIDGIELDQHGNVLAYHLLREHPGDGYAGIIGIDPRKFSLRHLSWMARGADEAAWNRVRAAAEVSWGASGFTERPLPPGVCQPYREVKKPKPDSWHERRKFDRFMRALDKEQTLEAQKNGSIGRRRKQ